MDMIAAKLDELAHIRAIEDATRIDYARKRTETLKSVQAELDAEYQPLVESSRTRIAQLETEIKLRLLKT